MHTTRRWLGWGSLVFVMSLAAQTPEWITLQGRVSVEGRAFHGWGAFKFALVAGAAPGTVVWHHDGTAPAEGAPVSALRLWVANGWFDVALGDASVSNMVAVPAGLWAQPQLRVRVWFNDGVHEWEQLAPDLRLGAVPYALHAGQPAAGSVTVAHLAPELQARLMATNGPAAGPESALVLAEAAQAHQWLQAGYAPSPLQFAQPVWKTDYLDPRVTTAFLMAPGTNAWDGVSLWLWRWVGEGTPGQGLRYDAAASRWQVLPVAGAPAFEPARSWASAAGGDWLVVEAGDGAWRGARYCGSSNTWETVTLPEGGPWPATIHLLNLPTGPVLLAAREERLWGAWWAGAENGWQAVVTNGLPALEWPRVRWAALTNGWLALGPSAGGVQLWQYQLAPPRWERLSEDGFSLAWSDSLRTVWTGAEWYCLDPQPAGWRGARYVQRENRWAALPAAQAPRGHAATQCLWNGRELMLVNLTVPATESAAYSARFDPSTGRWKTMNPAGPVAAFAPMPQYFPLGEELLMVRVGDPSRYAVYNFAADAWRPMDGPNLGWEALVFWTGAELVALPFQPPPEEPLYLHRYCPPRPVNWYYRPAP